LLGLFSALHCFCKFTQFGVFMTAVITKGNVPSEYRGYQIRFTPSSRITGEEGFAAEALIDGRWLDCGGICHDSIEAAFAVVREHLDTEIRWKEVESHFAALFQSLKAKGFCKEDIAHGLAGALDKSDFCFNEQCLDKAVIAIERLF
jgi:hypothetical protein